MSGNKGGKRISVFDRLGPGNDEGPPPTHRRYSSEKHSDKGRHTHPHVRGEEPPRERKPSSHQDFEDSKHLHYRDVPPHPPPPPPPSSHPRHRHFHETPETEYSEEEGGRRAPPRKPRETPEAVIGEGYPKHRVPPDDRGAKLVRGGGGGGGGKMKQRGGEGGMGRSSSESSAENEVASGNEGKRRRSAHHREMERRPRHSLESPNLSEDGGRRLPKHLEKKEKGNERHAHLERLAPPPGSGSNSEGKGPKPKGEGKDERESLGYHKRRREDEYLEPRPLERKRKREHLDEDLFPPETKKPRTADYLPSLKDAERQSLREGEEKYPGRMREVGEGGERKRRYEGREPPARKYPHLQSPDTRRHGWPPISSPGGAGRKGDHHHWKRPEGDEPRGSPPSETDSAADEAAAARKKLDWSSLSALMLAAKPKRVSTSALERFSPGVLLAQMGTSPLLAGPELYVKVSNTVSKYLREGQCSSGVQSLSESVLENPFGSLELASAGVSRLEQQQKLTQLFTDVGPCRRALTASVDFAMRRKLRKNNRDFLPSSHPPTNWDSEHYATGLALYQSLGTKASGKPAFRLHQSRVGTVLIAR